MDLVIINLIDGLFYGLLLFMLSSGLTLIFSMMDRPCKAELSRITRDFVGEYTDIPHYRLQLSCDTIDVHGSSI